VPIPLSIQDSVFDGTVIYSGGDPTNRSHAHNAYLANASQLDPAGPGNVTVTNFHWQTGPLGRFYHGITTLTEAGSAPANLLGLAHFTTQPAQTPEAGTVVDLGYHYLPVTANGLPLDTDSDGIPDYLDPDADGEGLPDAWEFAQFGNLGQHANGDPDYDELTNLQEWQLGTDPNQWDTDGDGVSDFKELTIPVDIDQPSLGFLDPLVQDTAGTGIPDGEKDSDQDGISNLGELREFGSDPGNPNTYTALRDSEYFLTAREGASGATMTTLQITHLIGTDLIQGQIDGALPGAEFDLYVAIGLTDFRII